MSGDFKEVKDNTEEVNDVAENGEVAKVGVSLTPPAMMRRVEPRAHDPLCDKPGRPVAHMNARQ